MRPDGTLTVTTPSGITRITRPPGLRRRAFESFTAGSIPRAASIDDLPSY
jgi:hypothetical protein